MPLPAKGSDGALRDLASRDLTEPSAAAQQAAVGDGWWDLSEKEGAPAVKQRLRERALLWYEKASGALTGLYRAKVD